MIVLALVLGLPLALAVAAWAVMIRMPGDNPPPPPPEAGDDTRQLADTLRRDVHTLAVEIGERNLRRPEKLAEAVAFLEAQFARAGYEVRRHTFQVRPGRYYRIVPADAGDPDDPVPCHNLVVEIPGTEKPEEIVVIGAHYDSAPHTPAANDNASGTAALLELARDFAGRRGGRTLRFVAFVNEEPPFFQTDAMGSLVYARACRERGDNIVAMLSLETIGYFSDQEGSQRYPPPFSVFYPSRGNFIGVVGNVASRRLVRRVVRVLREHATIPSEGGAVPGGMQGVGWSDHWSFWQVDYPAAMVTDTALFRYPYYHTPEDTPDKIDFPRMARAVAGLKHVLRALVTPD